MVGFEQDQVRDSLLAVRGSYFPGEGNVQWLLLLQIVSFPLLLLYHNFMWDSLADFQFCCWL